MQARDFIPELAVGLEGIDRVEPGVCTLGLSANIKNLFVEGFECGKVCAVAKCNGVSEDLLGACEPCWAQVRPVDADSGVSSKCAAYELCFCAERAGRACLDYVLVYCFCDMRNCQGTRLMLPFGWNHRCSKLDKRTLGAASASKCSPG